MITITIENDEGVVREIKNVSYVRAYPDGRVDFKTIDRKLEEYTLKTDEWLEAYSE